LTAWLISCRMWRTSCCEVVLDVDGKGVTPFFSR
jgi:hypothetical protein